MIIHRHHRLPPILILTLLASLSAILILSHRPAVLGELDAKLAELQAAVAKPDAKPALWLTYGQTLQAAKQFSRASVAYQHYLESDPYQRDARMACAACLAELGNSQDFFNFMGDTIAVMPKAAVEIFNRPESAIFLAEARFQTLQKNAIAGAMD